ncbi:MAG: ABC transporter permease [Planctomycetia bacterium]|nr:ABC transporter permease [Planctomycetia bacterium]
MTRFLINHSPMILLVAVLIGFSIGSPRFLTAQNAVNMLTQGASATILAAGMTWVLVTSGVDLSVGSLMFLTAAACGKMMQSDVDPVLAALVAAAIGPLCGVVHGLLIAYAGASPFIVTLASLFLLRGAGLWISRTRAMNLPEEFSRWASEKLVGVPAPVWVAGATVLVLYWLQTRTAFGRQSYAVGYDPAAARKAGVNVRGVLVKTYALSGACAALAALTSLTQLGAVSPTFGKDREFDAIAAAVLGGASLFGGRGNVFPGAVIGAMTVAAVFNGLNTMNANPYSYPLITAGVVFLAVLFDGLRRRPWARPLLATRGNVEGAR